MRSTNLWKLFACYLALGTVVFLFEYGAFFCLDAWRGRSHQDEWLSALAYSISTVVGGYIVTKKGVGKKR